MNMADSPLAGDLVYRTMKRCPAGCVLLVNVALNNPYNGHKAMIDALLENVTEMMTDSECAAWNLDGFPKFTYNGSGCTEMCTIGLRRQA
jgi:hypothetical protein